MTGRTGPRPMAHLHNQSYPQTLQPPAGLPTPARRCRPSWSQLAASSSQRVLVATSRTTHAREQCAAQLVLLCSLTTFNGAMLFTFLKLYQEVEPLLAIAGGAGLGLLWAIWLSSAWRWLQNLRLLPFLNPAQPGATRCESELPH